MQSTRRRFGRCAFAHSPRRPGGLTLWNFKAIAGDAAAQGKDLVREMVGRLKVDIMVARNRLKAIQSTSGDGTNRAALICYPVHSPGVDTAATVTLYLPEPLRSYCGGIAELPVTARTLLELLHRIEQTQPSLYPNICDETGAVRRHLNIFVNADNMRDLDGLQTALTNGDVVTVVPAVSGG